MDRVYPNKPVALITGAARRIGAVIAATLHNAGYAVIIHYHQSHQEARALCAHLNQKESKSALVLKADLTKKTQVMHLLTKSVAWKGRLDLLINNASLFLKSPVLEKEWQRLFVTNVEAPQWLSEASFPHLTETNGSIINITDIHGEFPLKGYSEYCQSKAALSMQTTALAKAFAPKVRVNAIAPGAIAWPENANQLSKAQKEAILEAIPLKAHGKPEYIADAVLFLSQNPYITGQILRVDGGRSLAFKA